MEAQKELIKFEAPPQELSMLLEIARSFTDRVRICSYSHERIKEGNPTTNDLLELLKESMVVIAMLQPAEIAVTKLTEALQRTLSSDAVKKAMGQETRKEY